VTAGVGLSGGGAVSLGSSVSLAADLNELTTETTIAQGDFVAMVDATDSGSGKITLSNLEDEIFGNVSGDATIAAGGALTIAATSVENSMLAGSIANAKLSNSAITIAGSSTSLGSAITAATIASAIDSETMTLTNTTIDGGAYSTT
jgi:hypothetical protein